MTSVQRRSAPFDDKIVSQPAPNSDQEASTGSAGAASSAASSVGTDRLIQWTTTLSVVLLAAIAAVLSYKHMYVLVRRYGEARWSAALCPISVDGMIAAASLSLLADSRRQRRGGVLPWTLLRRLIGSSYSTS